LHVAVLGLLCAEFQLQPHAGSGIRLWGHFEDGQMLPEHMWVTYTDQMIYDKMPGSPVRRNANQQGLNPPSNDGVLQQAVVATLEVSNLAAGTLAVVNTPGNAWAAGLG
jgi:hypothetical protein